MSTSGRRQEARAPGKQAAGRLAGDGSGGRTVQSLERAFSILEAVAAADHPVSLADITRATNLHTSTAFHLLKTLTVLGYVRQDDAKRYRIGTRLFMQAAGAFNEIELVNLAAPHLKHLADQTGETAHLAVRADSGIAVIAKIDAKSSIRANERVGIIRPAHCTAIGKVLLGALSDEELDSYLRTGPFQAFTSKTLTDPKALREEIRRVAAAGTAQDDSEFSEELRCIAAPVRNYTRQTVAALGISGPVWRVTLRDMARLSAIVGAVAADLSRELGFRDSPSKSRTDRADQ
jgi:IclR family acetate operon transcriptional repressor